MCNRERSGTALAKGKFKCLVGKRIGGREVARIIGVNPFPRHPTKKLHEIVGFLGKHCYPVNSFDRFSRGKPARNPTAATDYSPKLPLAKVTLRGFGQRFEKR